MLKKLSYYRIIGANDEMVSVETFMKQKCNNVEPDDSDSFRLAVDYGGWQVRLL